MHTHYNLLKHGMNYNLKFKEKKVIFETACSSIGCLLHLDLKQSNNHFDATLRSKHNQVSHAPSKSAFFSRDLSS
jgi:hypothetical protein